MCDGVGASCPRPRRRPVGRLTAPVLAEEAHGAACRRLPRHCARGRRRADVCSPEGRELDVLVDLAELYESRNEPTGHPSPVAAVEFRMEQVGP